jgi:hypothetical protein
MSFRRPPVHHAEVPRHCAGTEQYLTRFFSEMGMHEVTWLIRQPKSKDSGTEK